MSQEKYERILREKQNFFEGKAVNPDIIREEILLSWQRSRELGIPLEKDPDRNCRTSDIEGLLSKNSRLLSCSIPLMEKFISSFKRNNTLVVLYNSEGTVLHWMGNDVDFNRVPHNVVGNSAAEEYAGTTGVSLCLRSHETEEVFGPEHWLRRVYNRYAVCSPILSQENRLLGVLNVTQEISNYSLFTRGITELLAHAISEQIRLNTLLSERTVLSEILDIGVMLINRVGVILQCNTKCRKMLNADSGSVIPSEIMEVLTSTSSGRRIMDREIRIGRDRNAQYYILSLIPLEEESCVVTLQKAAQIRKVTAYQSGYSATYAFEDIIGNSVPMLDAIQLARRASSNDSNVLIYGESGTGKELFAQAIHNGSSRKNKPFIAINCGAIPKMLIQSELFGYAEGAFTGARKSRPGKFELAEGGTIFLDEISEMPFDVQVTLLRILQEKQVTRIGEGNARKIDVRIIAASNKNLNNEVAMGAFRKDLFYRINVLSLSIPPLRERKNDIPLLVEELLAKICKHSGRKSVACSPQVMEAFMAYDYPGNVRELENIIDRMVCTLGEGEQYVDRLPEALFPEMKKKVGVEFSGNEEECFSGMTLEQIELNIIIRLLEKYNGNINKVATILNISRNTIYNKMKKNGLSIRRVSYNDNDNE